MDNEAALYVEKYKRKIQALSERFSSGQINRQQYEALYLHYQSNLDKVQKTIQESPGSEDWKRMVAEGHSILLQRTLQARLKGYILFSSQGRVIRQGGFQDYPAHEILAILQKGKKPVEQDTSYVISQKWNQNHLWLALIFGQYTDGVMILSHEPAQIQLQRIVELHGTFENANRNFLHRAYVEDENMVFPQEFFLNKPL